MNENYQVVYPQECYQQLADNYQSIFVSESDFDWSEFYALLFSSLSLSFLEKHRVVDNVPTLSNYQVNELCKVFRDEIGEFQKLIEEESHIITGLIGKIIVEGILLMIYLGVIKNEDDEKKVIYEVIENYKRVNLEFVALTLEKSKTDVHWYYLLQQYNQYQTAMSGSDFDKLLDGDF